MNTIGISTNHQMFYLSGWLVGLCWQIWHLTNN